MSNLLRCKRCGVELTHADANIADIERSCEIVKNEGSEFQYTKPTTHDWEEIES